MISNNESNEVEKTAWLPWHEEGWFERVKAWIDAQLERNGRIRTGDIEMLHQRPWSSFARIPTNQDIVYFKAPAPNSISEARLTAALSRWYPDCTVPILAVDPKQGWLLTVHAGVTLRELSRTPDQLIHWQHIIPLYAELQRECEKRVPELLAMGVSDRRLALLPQKFDQLLADTENLRVG